MKKTLTNPILSFDKQVMKEILVQNNNCSLRKESIKFYNKCNSFNYSYHFKWLGRPIIQYPQDIVALQELIWRIKPDCIIETGIAHGGSIIFSASMIELLRNNGKVIGIDIDIRKHNRDEIEKHPLFKNIVLIEGSSIEDAIVNQVKNIIKNYHTIMVVLDSNHTHDHVLKELEIYASLVTQGSYIIVFDTIIEFLSKNLLVNRPWKKGSNPYTAVKQFLRSNNKFRPDRLIDSKLLLTCAPGGFLKKIK